MKKRKRLKTPQREPIYVRFGLIVAWYRVHRLEVSQEHLAKLTKRKRASIANIEAGRQRIYLADIFTFADAFRIDPSILLVDVAKGR